jgi:hypothetical protein
MHEVLLEASKVPLASITFIAINIDEVMKINDI